MEMKNILLERWLPSPLTGYGVAGVVGKLVTLAIDGVPDAVARAYSIMMSGRSIYMAVGPSQV